MNLDWQTIQARANSDGEFLLGARYWNTRIKIAVGSDHSMLSIADGLVDSVSACEESTDSDLGISAPDSEWAEMLARVPKPFYQDLYAARFHHDFYYEGDFTNFCAYYPAIRRLIEIMREVYNRV